MTDEKDQRWHEIYGHHDEIRAFFKDPYVKAIAPIIAGAIDITGKPEVNVLVIAGGKGRFSRDALPRVKELLRRKGGRSVRINVVESDISSVIREAAPACFKVMADARNLPFRAGAFDLVIGESMIHQGGPGQLPKIVKQIEQVLSERGSFIHTGDFTPDPRDWAPKERLRTFGMAKEVLCYHSHELDRLAEFSKIIHGMLLQKLQTHYRTAGLNSLAAEIEGRTRVNATLKRRLLGVTFSRTNHISFNYGVIQSRIVSSVPRKLRQITYTGYLSLASRLSTQEIIERAEKFR